MAHFGKDADSLTSSHERTIKIPRTVSKDNFTLYVIEVNIGSYTWTVEHRYSDFHELHDKLVSSYRLDKSLLPPKKVFGNQSDAFIKKRQSDLEVYLQTVIYYLAQKIPPLLATFLDFEQYEIHGITQALAEELYNRGESILHLRDTYTISALQLYALTERLKLPEPTCDSGDVKKDLGHILDFITRLKYLKVYGSDEYVGSSNINMNKLTFDLTLFKSLQYIEIINCSPTAMKGLETVKQTLQSIYVHNTLTDIREILLPDARHWKAEDGTLVVSYWDGLEVVDMAHNSITQIDDCIQMMPHVEKLDLSHNQITDLKYLQLLSQLTYLDLSYNQISNLVSLHTKLGNLKTLKLAGNKLKDLTAFSKLFSLEVLDVSHNEISLINDVRPVCGLPCLESLLLMGNAVTMVLDYRTKVLELFADRVMEVSLDNEKANQKEQDTVAVLQALQKAKDTRERAKQISNRKSGELSDVASSCTPPKLTGDPANLSRSAPPTSSTHPLHNPTHFSGQSLALDEESTQSQDITGSTLQPITKLDQLTVGIDNTSNQDTVKSNQENKINRHDRLSGITTSQSERSVVLPNIDTVKKKRKRMSLVNTVDLPSMNNTDFVDWLSQQLLTPEGLETRERSDSDKILDILWCKVIQFSKPDVLQSCCCVLTRNKLFIETLACVESSFEDVPDIKPVYVLPICNIKQLIIGLSHSYLRFEEAFVKHMGIFTLIGLDNKMVKSFLEVFKANCYPSKSSPDILDLSQDSDIAQLIFAREEAAGLSSDRIVLSVCVMQKATSKNCLLFLSECRVYLLPVSCCQWPWPTFDSGNYQSPRLEVLQEFDIMARISDIRMYQDSEPKLKSWKTNLVRFSAFGLSMMFHEALSQNFDILFPSMATRDFFLERLTNLRAEFAHRLSPTFREEPEGSNDPISCPDKKNTSLKSGDVYSLPSSFDLNKYYVQDILPHVLVETKKNIPDITLEIPSTVDEGSPCRSETDSDHSDSRNGDSFGLLSACSASPINYMTRSLEDRLKQTLRNYNLCKNIPTKLKPFALMDGKDLAAFFHANIAKFEKGEELRRVFWTTVVTYSDPKEEIVSLVLISTSALYVLADKGSAGGGTSRPPWMNHNRHKSDSAFAWKSSGSSDKSASRKRGFIKPLFIIKFLELQQVNVGLFDQCIRLTGQDENSVFTLVTRDGVLTEILLEEFKSMLSLMVTSPVADKSDNDLEQDFYKAFARRTKSTVEGLEYIHPSQVRFCYPGEDSIEDILYLIRDQLSKVPRAIPKSGSGKDQVLWMYMLAYITCDDVEQDVLDKGIPRTLILTNTHICLASEDIVTYPLPDFVRGLPETPRQEIIEIRKIINLKRVVLSKRIPQLVQLVFADDREEIVVDVNMDHFSFAKESKNREPLPEFRLTLLVQSSNEKNKFLQLLQKNWKEVLPEHEVGRILDIQTNL
ncbi:hypothetical protein SNE40_015286 [Patella caerulea]|uniref:PX domain-containing protein n=1 Tax=Patella caerulea TaxID=87958 RepID=A0AAN8PIY1_PATCE